MRIDKANCKTDISGRFDAETNRSARLSCALGYLFFFIPLTMHPESKFARYHANQGMILLLLMTVGVMIASLIPYAGPLLAALVIAYGAFCALRGMITAFLCQAKHIPLIGKMILIEYEDVYSLQA